MKRNTLKSRTTEINIRLSLAFNVFVAGSMKLRPIKINNPPTIAEMQNEVSWRRPEQDLSRHDEIVRREDIEEAETVFADRTGMKVSRAITHKTLRSCKIAC